jgi:PAS domain S-box-containing protein
VTTGDSSTPFSRRRASAPPPAPAALLRWVRFALDRTPDAAFVVAADARFTYVNETACRVLGYSREELLALTVADIEPDPAHPWDDAWDLLRRGEARLFETRHRRKDGSFFPVELSLNHFAYGGQEWVVAVARDITERKRAGERLELALRGANLGLWDWNLATGEVVLHPQWAEILGYTTEEIRPVGTAWRRLVHPADRDQAVQALRAHLAGSGDSYEAVYRLRAKSGEWRWVRDRGMVCERGADGRALRLAGSMMDITEQRLEEDKRIQQQRRIQAQRAAIVELATDHPVAAGDFPAAACTITEITARAMDVDRVSIWLLNEDRLELRCIDVYERPSGSHSSGSVIRVSDHPRYFEAVTTDRAIAAHDALNDPQTRELGESYLEPLGITSMLDACIRLHGEPAGVVCNEHIGPPRTWSDDEIAFAGEVADQAAQALANEERRRLEVQIQQAQKLESLGVLAGGIAHDFNNLLMAVLGNADLALTELPGDSSLRGYLEDIRAASRRAAELCSQMLAYSGRGQLSVETVDMGEMVREMASMLVVAISKRVVLELETLEDTPAVIGDPTQLRQVIMNLLTNASEAIGDRDGSITLRTGGMECDRSYLARISYSERLPPGRYAFVEVIDSGCGMDEATLERVFDPFFTTKFTGRGLGMAAVLGIVRGHRGAVRVTSAPGEGTTFRILLPACEGEPARQKKETDSGWRGTGTVLLVDDEESVRQVAKLMLERLGFEVLLAEDGRQGLELFRRYTKDIVCVLLDLTMPHMDGESCFRELQGLRSDLPVVLSSGFDRQDATRRFAGQGLAGFVQKPYSLAALQAALEHALASFRAARSLDN